MPGAADRLQPPFVRPVGSVQEQSLRPEQVAFLPPAGSKIVTTSGTHASRSACMIAIALAVVPRPGERASSLPKASGRPSSTAPDALSAASAR